MLLFGELEHEIRWEAVDIAAYSKIEVAGGDLVDLGKVGIEHDLSAAHNVDAPVNKLCGHRQSVGRG